MNVPALGKVRACTFPSKGFCLAVVTATCFDYSAASALSTPELLQLQSPALDGLRGLRIGIKALALFRKRHGRMFAGILDGD